MGSIRARPRRPRPAGTGRHTALLCGPSGRKLDQEQPVLTSRNGPSALMPGARHVLPARHVLAHHERWMGTGASSANKPVRTAHVVRARDAALSEGGGGGGGPPPPSPLAE